MEPSYSKKIQYDVHLELGNFLVFVMFHLLGQNLRLPTRFRQIRTIRG